MTCFWLLAGLTPAGYTPFWIHRSCEDTGKLKTMMGIQTENNGTKEKVCQYVYLSMFNDVNVCKCVLNVICRICKSRQTFTGFSYVSACSGLYQQLSWSQAADPICHLLEPTKRHIVFQAKDTLRYIYYDYTMYMAIAPLNDLRPGQILLFKRHWQPARGHHTLRPVPPTGKLTSISSKHPYAMINLTIAAMITCCHLQTQIQMT